jgi:hypothetical protein
MGSYLFVVAFCGNNKIWYWRQPHFEKVVITTIDLFLAIFTYKCRFLDIHLCGWENGHPFEEHPT